MAVRFTAEDLETGDRSEVVIEPGNYVVVAVEPCHVFYENHYTNGTSVITVKGRDPGLMFSRDIPTASSEVA